MGRFLSRYLLWLSLWMGLLLLGACESPPPRVTGVVLDAQSDAPIADAVVTVDSQAYAVDERGRFYIEHAPETFPLTVTATGYVGQRTTISLSPEVPHVHQAFRLVPRELQGVVRSAATEEPLLGAKVVAGSSEVATDQEGRFALAWPDDVPLQVGYRGYLSTTLSVSDLTPLFDALGQQRQPLQVILSPRVVTGTLLDAETAVPIAGALVAIGDQATYTNPEGRFRLSFVESGDPIIVQREGYRPQETPQVYDGAAELTLDLQPWQVRVQVNDAETGAPLPEALVADGVQGVITDEQGRAVVRLIKPGQDLEVSCPAYYTETIAFQGQDALTVTLRPSGLVIALRSKGEDPQPVSGGAVQIYARDVSTPTVLYSDEKGLVQILDGSQVTYVRVKVPGYRLAEAQVEHLGRLEIDLEPFQAFGLYVPFGLLSLPDRVMELVDLVDKTELNALVVDVKGDWAHIAWPSELPVAQEIGAFPGGIMDIRELLDECHKRDIYVIARIVVFKDRVLATHRPDWAVRTASGGLYRDNEGLNWMDPFRQEVRDYNIGLALEAAALGFDEIQFDYLRFPSWGRMSQRVYSQEVTFETRTEAIREFCRQAYEALSLTPAFVSADIFGLTVWVDPSRDMGIGQRVDDIAPYMDYLSPMLYPSTFIPGNLGLAEPWRHPYEIVYYGVRKVRGRTSTLIRPWLQSYSLPVTYGPTELLLQRRGAEDAGACGWLYWNAAGKYRPEVFGESGRQLMETLAIPPVD